MLTRMVSILQNVVIDCAHAYELARFWSEVTGHPVDPEDGPGDDEVDVLRPDGSQLHFTEVPEPKAGKNRIHLCLRPQTSCAEEVERLLGLGATLVSDQRKSNGWGWVVLADPEGNEFCILRSESERAALLA